MATSTSTPPWMPSPSAITPPVQPGYYQGSAADAGTVPPRFSGGSIGTFFAVIVAVLVLTLLSCIFGRVCRKQAEGPDELYDCGRLARRWCCRGAPPRRVVRREGKPPAPVAPVEEVPAALPPPEP